MAYDPLGESLRLLAGTAPSDTARLTRRVRHVALAVDRHDDVAATMFLRRGVSGEPWIDAYELERSKDEWRMLGGGSGNVGDVVLRPRHRFEETGELTISMGGGATRRKADRLIPWRAGWVRQAELRLAVEVSTLVVASRRLPVASHGAAVVVWASKSPPDITAVDAAGTPLGRIAIDGF